MIIEDGHVQCQNCRHLDKLSYEDARPTHHENWQCSRQGITLQYEFTVAYVKCSRFDSK
jgi:hypothetical protein